MSTPRIDNAAGVGCMTQLVNHLIYGDIEEMPLSILGDDCPDVEYYNTLDREQQTRLAAAATVLAWSQGKLHPSGFLLTNTDVDASADDSLARPPESK